MKNKEAFIVIGILILVVFGVIIYKACSLKEYTKNYFYMDTYINVKLYTNSEKKANNAFAEIDNIYKTYHNLTNKYEDYPLGLYALNHGSNVCDYRLHKMIEYGYSWYTKTDGLLSIAIGNLSDVWKKYIELKEGVPTSKELKVNIDMSDAIIREVISSDEKFEVENGITLNNGVTLDLGAISKGYTTELVGEYLKNAGIKKYIINAGGNVLVGEHYKNKAYKIGIENPNGEGIAKVIKGENIAVVTSGGYKRGYTYDGVRYNHIINPKTKYPADNFASVTVISSSSKEADALSTSLFLMDLETGKEFIKDYDVEVIWFLKDGSTYTTEGISKYE